MPSYTVRAVEDAGPYEAGIGGLLHIGRATARVGPYGTGTGGAVGIGGTCVGAGLCPARPVYVNACVIRREGRSPSPTK